MATSDGDAQRYFDIGEFATLLELSKDDLRKPRALSPARRVLLANTLVFAGDLDTAHGLVSIDQGGSAPLTTQSQVQSILGLINWRRADLDAAVNCFRSALQLAHESKDAERIAWAHLHSFRFAVDSQPLDAVMALMPEVRKAVTHAGDRHISAYLHCCVSVLEGQMGRLDEAWRHCEITESLLEGNPNAWIRSHSLLNRACIACLRCEFGRATKYIKLANELIDASGNVRLKITADSTLGYVEVLTGQFEKGRHTLQAVAEDPRVHQFAKLPTLDTLARLCLALNDLDGCESALTQIGGGRPLLEGIAPTYNKRWTGITKARLLLKRGQFDDARRWLVELQTHPDTIRDVPFNAALNLVAAEVLIGSGDTLGAAESLLIAGQKGIADYRDLQGQYYFCASTAVGRTSLGNQLHTRALRLWGSQGLVSMRLELDRNLKSLDVARRELRAAVTAPAPVPQTLDCLADAIAAVFDVAYHPRLLASELLAIIRALECSPDTQVVETRTTEPEATPGRVTLPLGTIDHKKLTLVCAVPSEPAQAVLLGNVLRIGRSALALEKAHQDERSRSALWPASPVEEQAGALFLAEEMQTLLSTARRIATTNVPVLITGETGTGKEILARTIHGYSLRATKTFLPFNCTATPREMLDAQLFGHRRGAFTGATEHFPGIIRAAAGGTLFLDEIGEATLDAQPKLLRFLDSGEVHPIGDTHPAHVDVRIIAATNADLDSLVTQGRFREDLFYRLNIVRLHVPPLRERRSEVPALANHYLLKYGIEAGRSNLRLSEETMEYLVLYRWPGNVRQLANEMRRIAVLAENGAVLMPEHLSPSISASRRTIPASERHLDLTEVVVRLDQPMPAAVQHLERAMIQYALQKSGGRMEDTAARLGVSRKGLYLKRQRFGLETPSGDVGLP